AKINYNTTSQIQTDGFTGNEYFNVMNIDKYNVIIGTPFMHRNRVILDFDDKCVMINDHRRKWIPCRGKEKAEYTEEDILELRQCWHDDYEELLQGVPESMPPFREVNHEILLIDTERRYHYHLPRCPNSLKAEFNEKVEKYMRVGWWKLTAANQAAPMLCLLK
ncbi:hypothetical protein ARMGADRAFT_873637, partial [Armillaria gallica]